MQQSHFACEELSISPYGFISYWYVGTFDLPMPHETATLSTGYSRLNPERWLKYLHQTTSSCSLQLDTRLGSAEQLTTVADAISGLFKQQQRPSVAPHGRPPDTISLASNNLGQEAIPLVCNLCAACPQLQRLDLSSNRHLFSAPLEPHAANTLTSLFFTSSSSAPDSSSSRKDSVTGQLKIQRPNVLDAPMLEASAATDLDIHAPATVSWDDITPSDLESLALNGNVIDASMTELVISCLQHQQQLSEGPHKACGLRELHLEDAEIDAVAFATLLWGTAPPSTRSSHQGGSSGMFPTSLRSLSNHGTVPPHVPDAQSTYLHISRVP